MTNRWAFSVYEFDRGHVASTMPDDPLLEEARRATRAMDLWELLGEKSPLPSGPVTEAEPADTTPAGIDLAGS
jgi:hypothetical protein